MGTRRKGREAALQILYMADACNIPTEHAARLFWGSLAQDEDGRDFATELLLGYQQNIEQVDETIRGVSEHWRMERMSVVDRNILRLSTFELLAEPSIPRRVTLNEAVELAKRYGSDNSPSFVNGVLDRIAENLKKS